MLIYDLSKFNYICNVYFSEMIDKIDQDMCPTYILIGNKHN
jgi:hypothetical protein